MSHRSAIIDAVDEINQIQKINLSIFIGTKIILKNLLNLKLFKLQREIVIFYFTGLGRIYTDYGVFGKFAFIFLVYFLGFWKKSNVIVENISDYCFFKKLYRGKIYQINGSGLFMPYSAKKVIICKKSTKSIKNIIYISRFGKSKCTDQIVKLVHNLPNDVNLKIIGQDISGKKYSKIFTKISHMYPNVSYLGWINKKNELYNFIKQSDVLIYPSVREGCPFTILESINLGTLPILSNTPGSNELAKDLDLPSIDPLSFKNYEILNSGYMNFFLKKKSREVFINNFDKYRYVSVKRNFIKIFNDISHYFDKG